MVRERLRIEFAGLARQLAGARLRGGAELGLYGRGLGNPRGERAAVRLLARLSRRRRRGRRRRRLLDRPLLASDWLLFGHRLLFRDRLLDRRLLARDRLLLLTRDGLLLGHGLLTRHWLLLTRDGLLLGHGLLARYRLLFDHWLLGGLSGHLLLGRNLLFGCLYARVARVVRRLRLGRTLGATPVRPPFAPRRLLSLPPFASLALA
ncbi:hypothetical protein JCM30237_25810 [Halolamina litorea]